MLRFIAFELSRMIRMIRKLRAAHLSRAALHRATLLSMADQARSLHAEDREVAGDDNAHLTKKRCLALEHENGSHGHGAESDQANHSTEAATQYDNMTETAQAGFYMLETRVGVADSKVLTCYCLGLLSRKLCCALTGPALKIALKLCSVPL